MFPIRPHRLNPTLITMLFVCVLTVFAFGPLFVSAQATPLPNTAPTPTANPIQNNGSVLPPLNYPTAAPPATNPGKEGANREALKLQLDGMNLLLYQTFTGLGGMFLWLGGILFDSSMSYFLSNMGKTIIFLGIDVAIDNVWTIIRDIFNLIFIFSLIFIGFRTILDAESSSAKKALGYLIAAALLINFSLYFTKVVIDFSNLAAFQIYQLVNVEGEYQSTMFGGIGVKGIAGTFMKYTDITSYAGDTADTLNEWHTSGEWSGTGKILGFSLMVMAFMLMAAFVFLAGAFLILARFIALIYYMMLSPLMFLGWIYPGLGSYTSKWWHSFFNQAVVGPAFLFTIYISLFVLQSGVVLSKNANSSFRQAVSGESVSGGFFGTLVFYVLVIGFLYASIIVAKKFGGAAGAQAISAAHSVRRKVTGAALSMSAMSLRSTIGWAGSKVAGSSRLKDAVARGGAGGLLARGALGVSRTAENASFDVRNTPLGKSLDSGTGIKSYKKSTEEYVKKKQEFAKSLGEVGDDENPFKEPMDDLEKQLKAARRAKGQAKGEEAKRAAQERIDDLEDQFETAQKNYRQEKHRRQTGSVAQTDAGVRAKLDSEIEQSDNKIKEIKATLGEYSAQMASGIPLTSEQEGKQNELLAQLKEEKKKKSKAERSKRTGGYANVIGSRNPIYSWITGTTAGKNKAAGDAIRKEYDKKVKQNKEKALVDELKEAAGSGKEDKK